MADAEATCLGGYSLAPETSPNESAEGAIFKQGHKVTNGRIGSDQTTTAVIQDTGGGCSSLPLPHLDFNNQKPKPTVENRCRKACKKRAKGTSVSSFQAHQGYI